MSYRVLEGDCVSLMAAMPAGSVDAVVCDPPYGLEFMGKDWDNLGRNSPPSFEHSMQNNFKGFKPLPRPGGLTLEGMHASQEWHQAWATEALRVLKPGGHLLAMGGPRTIHRLVCAVEDAGFEIRDMLSWNFGSGFPKSRNVTDDLKAVVPAHERCACAHRSSQTPEGSPGDCPAYPRSGDGPPQPASDNGQAAPLSLTDAPVHSRDGRLVDAPDGAPASTSLDEASAHLSSEGSAHPSEDHQSGSPASGSTRSGTASSTSPDGQTEPHRTGHRTLDTSSSASDLASSSRSRYENLPRCSDCQGVVIPEGTGTALKPAWEGITLARKPLSGTVAGNVLEHGTGALNVDGCRVEGEAEAPGSTPPSSVNGQRGSMAGAMDRVEYDPTRGRWPANVVLSHSEGCVQVGVRKVKSGDGKDWSQEKTHGTGAGSTYLGSKPTGQHYGMETVGAWSCTPECPVRLLDEQTGELTSGRGQVTRGFDGSPVYGDGDREFESTDRGFGDSGGASRFFYCAKAGRGERSAGLNGAAERDSKIPPCRCREANGELSPPRDTDAPDGTDDSRWSTSGSGSGPTGPSPTDTKSTTVMETSRTTSSPISSSSPLPTTGASILPSTERTTPASGSDAAPSVASGSPPTPSTTTLAEKAGPSTAVADPATSQRSSRPSSSAENVCPDCGGVVGGALRNSHPT